jgi:PIN domain nuclease of toxin-antitoxin system
MSTITILKTELDELTECVKQQDGLIHELHDFMRTLKTENEVMKGGLIVSSTKVYEAEIRYGELIGKLTGNEDANSYVNLAKRNLAIMETAWQTFITQQPGAARTLEERWNLKKEVG